MRQRTRPLLVLVMATVIAVLLGACGVQSDSSPRKIAAEDVPFDLLAPATSVGPSAGDEGVGRTVWFVDNNGLLARGERALPTPITPDSVLTALLQGVTDAEANNGLRSNIASGTKLLAAKRLFASARPYAFPGVSSSSTRSSGSRAATARNGVRSASSGVSKRSSTWYCPAWLRPLSPISSSA